MTAGAASRTDAYRSVAKQHVDHIARHPRPAGGEAEREAQRYCRDVLESAGYSVTEETFTYSAFPGRYATPLGGVFSMLVIATAAGLGYSGRASAAVGVLGVSAIVLALFAIVLSLRGVLGLAWFRETSVNMVASRGEPKLWLMAHSDTKSQPISMAARVSGIVASVLVWIGAAVLGGAGMIAGVSDDARTIGWPALGLAGVLAGIPVAASLVGSRSPGAFDNASGVATVLLAAATATPGAPLGVVITSAEELGMAGARAWVRGRQPGVAINVDGVDDSGMLTAMTTRRSARLALIFDREAASAGVPHRRIRLVPGILTDAVALTDAGWESITLSHGTLRSLSRIHTEQDATAHITGDGVARAAVVIAAMVTQLT